MVAAGVELLDEGRLVETVLVVLAGAGFRGQDLASAFNAYVGSLVGWVSVELASRCGSAAWPPGWSGACLDGGPPAGLRLQADDINWSWGSGPEVTGTAEAILMAVAGRPAALAGLSGEGLPMLAGRVTQPLAAG